MTTSLGMAFGEGLHRERELFPGRGGWTIKQWWDRKQFLEDMINTETDRADLARLQGRLMAVCIEGQTRFA